MPPSNDNGSENLKQYCETGMTFIEINNDREEIIGETIEGETIEGETIEYTREEETRNTLNKLGSLKALIQLICLFMLSVVIVYSMLQINLPPFDDNQKQKLRLPKCIEDLQELNKILSEYMDQYYFNVMTTYSVVYVFMWLSILGGALFGLPISLLIICGCSAIGSSNCYLLSKTFGKSLVHSNFSTKLSTWSSQLHAHSRHLLNYMIILRLMPFPPNWFANIAAPHVGVPFSIFFVGTFLGVAGPSLIHVQAGLTINNLTSSDEFQIFSWTNVGALVLIGVAVLIPVLIKRRKANFSNQGTYGTFSNFRTEVSQTE
ncbi:6397_t:CDS:2 [Diversispora eburnea]|uniref:6397_t:CDS:1 n=1 Tax=Diversispora eburnea TaxID=1213867 RepID=A0A9N9FGW8_9GLOM|nr:6397_t:CDS:2 [Diversispora eburnea]